MKRRAVIRAVGTAGIAAQFSGCAAFIRKSAHPVNVPTGEMPRKILGKTGIPVSRLSFGSHVKPELIARPQERDAMIKLGFESGINLFDVYDHSDYKQFKPMGASLSGFRSRAVISLCAVKSTDMLDQEIDDTLVDFATDYIDLYRLFTVDDDRMNHLERMKKAGKIRAIGVVSHDVGTMMGYIDRYAETLDYVMIIYNFHHNTGWVGKESFPSNDHTALIPRCERMNLGILGIKPMGSDSMVELARKQGFFKDKSADIAQAMLRHVYACEEIGATMPAMNSMDELTTNLASVYAPAITLREEELLARLSDVAAATKTAYLHDRYKWLESWKTDIA